MKNGMSKAEAEEEAVRQMGNPEEAGNELNQIHARVLDFSMFWWMMFFAFLVPVFEVISRLVTAGKYGIVGFMNEYQGMNQIPLQVHLVVGTAILCYGIILSIWEKYSGKELFYAYGRNWKGSYLTNQRNRNGIGRSDLFSSNSGQRICKRQCLACLRQQC